MPSSSSSVCCASSALYLLLLLSVADLTCAEREAADADPDGQSIHPSTLPFFPSLLLSFIHTAVAAAAAACCLMMLTPARRARGWSEGDLRIMGSLHPHRPPHHRPLHQLHAADAQDPGRT